MRRRRNSASEEARLTAQVDAEVAEEFRKSEAREREEQRLTSTIIVRAPIMLAAWLEIKRREKQARLPGHRVSTSDVVRGIITEAMRNEKKGLRRA